jgi:hypothetical protein
LVRACINQNELQKDQALSEKDLRLSAEASDSFGYPFNNKSLNTSNPLIINEKSINLNNNSNNNNSNNNSNYNSNNNSMKSSDSISNRQALSGTSLTINLKGGIKMSDIDGTTSSEPLVEPKISYRYGNY